MMLLPTRFLAAGYLLLPGSVCSFRAVPPSAIKPTTTTPGAITSKPLSPTPRTPSSSLRLAWTNEVDIEEIQQKIVNITDTLAQAMKRKGEALENVDKVREERDAVISETEKVIDSLKSSLRYVECTLIQPN